jgi:hypothetical protein
MPNSSNPGVAAAIAAEEQEHKPSARDVRMRAGYSQTAAAAMAGVAPGTWRAFELDEDKGTTRKIRARCRQAVSKMAAAAEAA